jgi:hypothetical protein
LVLIQNTKPHFRIHQGSASPSHLGRQSDDSIHKVVNGKSLSVKHTGTWPTICLNSIIEFTGRIKTMFWYFVHLHCWAWDRKYRKLVILELSKKCCLFLHRYGDTHTVISVCRLLWLTKSRTAWSWLHRRWLLSLLISIVHVYTCTFCLSCFVLWFG